MPRVVHFEIHAENPERARKFYGDLFGWEFAQFGGPMDYWIIRTGSEGQPGIDGGLVRRVGAPPVGGQPVNAYVCTVDGIVLNRSFVTGEETDAQERRVPGGRGGRVRSSEPRWP